MFNHLLLCLIRDSGLGRLLRRGRNSFHDVGRQESRLKGMERIVLGGSTLFECLHILIY